MIDLQNVKICQLGEFFCVRNKLGQGHTISTFGAPTNIKNQEVNSKSFHIREKYYHNFIEFVKTTLFPGLFSYGR